MLIRHKVIWVFTAFAALILVGITAFLFSSDFFTNGYVKNRIVKAFTKACPAYSLQLAGVHYNILRNRVGFDRIAINSNDSAFSCIIGKLSVVGISWLSILRHEDIASKGVTGSVADAREITLNFRQARYELLCKRLRVSLSDSAISADHLEFHPIDNDAKFFSSSAFRRTRFRINLPKCTAIGADCIGLLQGKAYRARAVNLIGAVFDILVNQDTPAGPDSQRPLMPYQALSSIKKMTRVNVLNIINGRMNYDERYILGSPPAEVTFDSVDLSVQGLTNRAASGATAFIRGQGTFMKTSRMKISMIVPVISPKIPLRYSGSLDGMELARLNSFLETGERLRIKSGVLETATFDISITAGRATGSLRAMYKDLSIAVLGKVSGSEKGALNRIASFMTNAVKIRGTNMPDKSGVLKIGSIKYEQKQFDTFLQLVWFSLRSGIGDVVGF
jgi:hypothetical protein